MSDKLLKVEINNNENLALNVMVQFLEMAQKRGVFTLEEAAKIYECIKVFKSDFSKKKPKNPASNSMKNAPKEYTGRDIPESNTKLPDP